MIDLNGTDLDAVMIEHHTLANLAGVQFNALRRIAAAAHPDIDMKRQRQVLHHLPRSFRTVNLQRLRPLPPRPADPTGEPEIGKADDMIRVMMG
jgi:hypothetical protein